MEAIILAGGFGSRITEESEFRPKPMIEIGGFPMLWHIMKIYSHYGINEFIICLGYKGYFIKEYFSNYFLHMSDVTFDLEKNNIQIHNTKSEPWKVTLVDTGQDSMTGGRLKRVATYIKGDTFCFTYGDGVCDVNIKELIQYSQTHGRLATMLAVQNPGRFGAIHSDENDLVTAFEEKPHGDGGWINGGFFVLNKKAIDYIEGDQTVWEKTPLENLTRDGQLMAYKHKGFWFAMDTLRDKIMLENYWSSGKAPWKVW